MTYTPFSKQLTELTANDLENLIKDEIAEGYWIEYKSEFQSSNKIAKSISSFANTYGGWYFVGVEAEKTKNVATKICGFYLTDIPDPIAKLRDSIKANIDPVPIFHSKVIDIGSGKVVLVVHIPENQETPFINKDGRLYRRISDSSDPIPEDNRFALDRLVDNGQEIAKEFAEFCNDERTFSKAEENQSWLNIFLTPYPLGAIERSDMLSTDGIENLIKLSKNQIDIYFGPSLKIGTGNLPFNSSQLGIGSVILRQVEQSKVAFNSLTMELFIDGRAKLFIPIKIINPLDEKNPTNIPKSLETKQALKEISGTQRLNSSSYLLRFFDVIELWKSVLVLLSFYQECFGKTLEQNNTRIAISLNNIWRLVPFYDSDEWGTYVKKFGLPIQQVDSTRIPNKKGKAVVADFPLANTVCVLLSLTFGLPPDIQSDIILNIGMSNQTKIS